VVQCRAVLGSGVDGAELCSLAGVSGAETCSPFLLLFGCRTPGTVLRGPDRRSGGAARHAPHQASSVYYGNSVESVYVGHIVCLQLLVDAIISKHARGGRRQWRIAVSNVIL
jgi:hypothetical protein